MRWIGYVRVSTDEQAGSGLGLLAQEGAIRGALSIELGAELVDVIHDDGVSGASTNRPGLHRALALIAGGRADGLIVSKLDRASRSVVDVAELLRWFDQAGAALRALDVGLDTSTPTGRLVAHVLASVAEWERSTIAARTRDAMAELRAQGRTVSRPAVSGDVAETIRTMRAAGATWQAIADRLNADGVPTVRGGTMWRPSSVQRAGGLVRRPSAPRPPALPAIPRRRRARGVEHRAAA